MALPAKLAEQIEHILVDLHRKTEAECVLLADVSGRLISVQGQASEVDPVLMAVVGAADVVATAELIRQIGEQDPSSALLREGKHVNVYLFDVAGRFVLIVIFRASTLAALVRTFGGRTAKRLRPLAAEFEDWMNKAIKVSDIKFGATLAEEMDKVFEGL